MEQLVKLISEKTGISNEQAKSALSVVTGFLKEKMPVGIGSQVEGFLSGGTVAGVTDQVKDKLGSFFK